MRMNHPPTYEKKKPYVCDKCGKAFSQKSGLSSHNTFQHPDPNKGSFNEFSVISQALIDTHIYFGQHFLRTFRV